MKDDAVTEFLKLFFQEDIPEYIEGDDLGTTCVVSGAVILASILSETRSPSRLSKMTGLPAYFAACVMANMNMNGFWNCESFLDLCTTICATPSGATEIDEAIEDFLDVFWNQSQVEELGPALVAARGGALLHGKTQNWVDPETHAGLGNLQIIYTSYVN